MVSFINTLRVGVNDSAKDSLPPTRQTRSAWLSFSPNGCSKREGLWAQQLYSSAGPVRFASICSQTGLMSCSLGGLCSQCRWRPIIQRDALHRLVAPASRSEILTCFSGHCRRMFHGDGLLGDLVPCRSCVGSMGRFWLEFW